jgi:hypothetical protein
LLMWKYKYLCFFLLEGYVFHGLYPLLLPWCRMHDWMGRTNVGSCELCSLTIEYGIKMMKV